MVIHADEREVKRPNFLPDEMSDSDVHDFEFTIALNSDMDERTEQAPMLDALARFRRDRT